MASEKVFGSIKRFGPRYGRTVKKRLAKIESMQKEVYTCPYCSKRAVKRVSSGIWRCSKCGSLFTSKAYSVEKPKSISAAVSVEEEGIIDVKELGEKEESED